MHDWKRGNRYTVTVAINSDDGSDKHSKVSWASAYLLWRREDFAPRRNPTELVFPYFFSSFSSCGFIRIHSDDSAVSEVVLVGYSGFYWVIIASF